LRAHFCGFGITTKFCQTDIQLKEQFFVIIRKQSVENHTHKHGLVRLFTKDNEWMNEKKWRLTVSHSLRPLTAEKTSTLLARRWRSQLSMFQSKDSPKKVSSPLPKATSVYEGFFSLYKAHLLTLYWFSLEGKTDIAPLLGCTLISCIHYRHGVEFKEKIDIALYWSSAV